MDYHRPVDTAHRYTNVEDNRTPSVEERLTAVVQEDRRRMNGWLPSSLPEQYRPDKHVGKANRAQRVGKHWDKATDLYIAIFYIAILGAFLTGIVNFLGTSINDLEGSGSATRSDFAVIQSHSLINALGLICLSWVGRLATALGPASVDEAQASWWLSLPVRTAPLLRTKLSLRLITATFLGFVASLFVVWGVGEASSKPLSGGLAGILSTAISSGLMVLLVMSISSLAQTWGWRPKLRKLWSVVPGITIMVLIVETIIEHAATWPETLSFLSLVSPTGWLSLTLQGGLFSLMVPATLAIFAGLITWGALARIEKIKHADLIEAGATSAQLSGWLPLLESRSVSTVLLGGDDLLAKVPTPKKSFRRPRPPAITWALADLIVLLRSPASRGGLFMGTTIVLVVVFSEPGRNAVLLCIAVGLASLMVTRGLAVATDELAGQPALQKLLPIGHKAAWAAHTIAPATLLLPWGVVVGVVLGWALHGPENFVSWLFAVVIAVFSALALSASTVRFSTRPPVDWSLVLMSTHANRISNTVARSMAHGVDTALLAVLPLALTSLLAQITAGYVLFSLGVCILAWCIAINVSSRHRGLR